MEELTKELAKRLMEIKGEARGTHFKNDSQFVLKEKGKEGLEMVERELEKLGYPIEYKKINQFAFYPIGLRVLSLLAIKKTFDWSDKKIEELCAYAMKVSLIIKLSIRHFFSVERVLNQAPRIWSKYFTVGRLKIEEHNLEKKYLILKIENFDLHPIYCCCLKGVLLELTKMIITPKKMTCEEIECSFRGGKGHRYLVKWQ